MVVMLIRFRFLAGLLLALGALLVLPSLATAGVKIVAPAGVTAGEAIHLRRPRPPGTETASFYVDGNRTATRRRRPGGCRPATLRCCKAVAMSSASDRRNGHNLTARRAITVVSTTRGSGQASPASSPSSPKRDAPGPSIGSATKLSEAPRATETPKSTEGPSKPEAPKAPEVSKTPEAPVTPAPPVTPETPGTSSSFPVFDGSHISNYSLLPAAPGAITEVADPLGSGETVFQMNVNNSDVAPITPTDNPRAQALGPGNINAGDEFWLETKFMLPENLPISPRLDVTGRDLRRALRRQRPLGRRHQRQPILLAAERHLRLGRALACPIKGSWVTVLLHERFATDGWVEMWINGE